MIEPSTNSIIYVDTVILSTISNHGTNSQCYRRTVLYVKRIPYWQPAPALPVPKLRTQTSIIYEPIQRAARRQRRKPGWLQRARGRRK